MLMRWRRLQPAGSRLVSTQTRRDESRRGTQECVRHVLTPATVFCEAPVKMLAVRRTTTFDFCLAFGFDSGALRHLLIRRPALAL